MFRRTNEESVSVKSSWRYEKSTVSQDTQTDEVNLKDGDVQFPIKSAIAVQTETESNEMREAPATFSFDSQRLNKFLEKAIPVVKEEIEKSLQFREVWEQSLKFWEKSENEVRCIRSFYSNYIFQLLNDQQKVNKYSVSSATLNCSATSVAVGYKVTEHDDWCTHQSFIFIWSLFRNYAKNSKPSLVVDVDGCISAMEAHNSLPSVYAIGTINGKIIVVNTRLTDSDNFVMSVSPTVEYSHKDSITVLKWVKRSKKADNLVTCSLDGKLIIWTLKESKKELEAMTYFLILLSDMPRTMAVKSSSAKSSAEVGIVSFSLSTENDDIFVIGCQGGALFQCSFNSSVPAKIDSQDFNFPVPSDLFKSPINLAYVPHRSDVTSVHFSPHSRNLFLSAGLDNELRVYTQLDSKPIAVFHCESNPLSSKWLPLTQMIVCSHENGLISFYVFNENKKSLKAGRTVPFGESHKAITVQPNYFESNSEIVVITNAEEVQIIDFGDALSSLEDQLRSIESTTG